MSTQPIPRIIVKRSRRYGLNAGCWWISRAQARKLCGGVLPRVGYDRIVKKCLAPAYFPGGLCINREAEAYVSNWAGKFIVFDEAGILPITER